MKCPLCEQEIPGSPCPACEAIMPEGAQYCMECGSPLARHEDDIPLDADSGGEDDGFDFDNRILCPDGTCTGIIIDGRCSECGRSYEGEEEKGVE